MKIRLDPGFQAKLAAQPSVRAAEHAAAEAVGHRAEQRIRSMFTPGRLTPFLLPRGQRLLEVESDATGARAYNQDRGWHLYEYGSARTSPAAPMRLAAKDVGLRLDEH